MIINNEPIFRIFITVHYKMQEEWSNHLLHPERSTKLQLYDPYSL
jgi:hypothetical protein